MCRLRYQTERDTIVPKNHYTLYQGNTLSLTNVVTFPHCFRTAYKKPWHLPLLAGKSDSKNPDLYYSDVSIIKIYEWKQLILQDANSRVHPCKYLTKYISKHLFHPKCFINIEWQYYYDTWLTWVWTSMWFTLNCSCKDFELLGFLQMW